MPLIINVTDGRVVQKNLLVHFPIPARRIWDNVIYTCANILVFANIDEVQEWCSAHNISQGEILPLEQTWELAKRWYGNYLAESWTRKTSEYAESIFKEVGLTGDFWRLT